MKKIYYKTTGFLQGTSPKGQLLTVWHKNRGGANFFLFWNNKWYKSFGQQELFNLFGISPRKKYSGVQSGYPSEPVIRAVWRYFTDKYNQGEINVIYSKTEPDLNPEQAATKNVSEKNMKQIIYDIISSIPKNTFFDSHYIIMTVIKSYSDEYLKYVAENPAECKITEYVHSRIAKIISELDGSLVERIPGKSISYNIRWNDTPCALWKKL